MSRHLPLALLALGVLAPATPGQMIASPRILPSRAALDRLDLERAWFTAIPIQTGVERVLQASLADGLIFVQTTAAHLHTFEAESGRLIWSSSIGRATGQALDVAVNSRFVFATNANTLHCLDRGTGRPVWDIRLQSFAKSGTAATEELVMLGLENGQMIAYSLVPPADSRYRRESGPPGGFAFTWATNGPITSRPIPSEYVVAFASTAGKVYVARLNPEVLLSRSQPLGSIVADMATFGTGPDSTLLVPSMDNNLYSINLFTGNLNWAFTAGAPIRVEPLIGSGMMATTQLVPESVEQVGPDGSRSRRTVNRPVTTMQKAPPTAYVLNEAGVLHAVDIASGAPQAGWSPYGVVTGAETILTVGAARVYLQTRFGDLVIVDRATGALVAGQSATRERAGLDLREYTVPAVNELNDRIYLASPFGSLICLRERGALRPTPTRDPSEAPFGALDDLQSSPAPAPGFRGDADEAPVAPEQPGEFGGDGFGFGRP